MAFMMTARIRRKKHQQIIIMAAKHFTQILLYPPLEVIHNEQLMMDFSALIWALILEVIHSQGRPFLQVYIL